MADIGTILDLIDVCVKVVKAINEYKGVDGHLKVSLRDLETSALRFGTLSDVMDRLRRKHVLYSPVKEDAENSISLATDSLDQANRVIEEWKRKLEDRARVKQSISRIKYAFKGKDDVEEHISNLRDSNRNLHDGIQLIPFCTRDTREIADAGVIEFLKDALSRAASGRELSAMSSFCEYTPYTDKAGVQLRRARSGDLINELFINKTHSMRIAMLLNGSRTRALPNKGKASAFIALPRCKCIGFDNDSFVFELPVPNEDPVSLLAHLIDSDTLYTLESRVALALHLARAVLVIHSLGLVHKNIRSDTIVVLATDRSQPGVLGVPCILGWGAARDEEEESGMSGLPMPYFEAGFDASIYRHPKHDTEKRTEKMQMRDDVYSLGVCLLEIALWESLASTRHDSSGQMSAPMRDIQKMSKDSRKVGGELTRHLVDIAKKWVPVTMGSVFTDIVVTCLECWDDDVNDNYENDYDDEEEELRRHLSSEARISIKFSKRVVKKLARIHAGIAPRLSLTS